MELSGAVNVPDSFFLPIIDPAPSTFQISLSNYIFFPADIDLPSWLLSVHNITSSSVLVEWADFPLNVSISHLMVMFTEENTNISVLFKVSSLYDRKYFVEKLLKPHRMYKFQVLAFTGGVENVTYSTEIQTIMTAEGGKAHVTKV